MRRICRLAIITVFVVAIIGFSYSYYEARNIKTRKYTFAHQDLPSAFDGKSIVFVADFHCNRFFTPDDVKNLVSDINELNPDIVMLGGDYVDRDSIYSIPFFEEIGKLKATYGIYTVLGNHDYWEDIELIEQGLSDCGFNICDNQSYWIHEGQDSIKIGGVGDLWEDKQLIDNTIDDINASDFCILLSHNPDYIELLSTDKVDLMLSGHTHGGQVTLFGLYAPIMPSYWRPNLPNVGQKYRYGWKNKGNTELYITTGAGVGEFPFRFFAAPEIIHITLRKE